MPNAAEVRRPGFAHFAGLRLRLFRGSLGVLMRGNRVRLLSIALCSALVWAGIFLGSLQGFTFLETKLALLGPVVNLLFDFLFLSLATLILFSTGIILFDGLFKSPEAKFLLGTPAPADQVFSYLFQGAVAVSSWAFLLLGSPVLIAFGVVLNVSVLYYLLLPLFFVGFVLLPGSLGALCCLGIANWFPRRPRQVMVGAVIACSVLAVVWVYRTIVISAGHNLGSADSVQRLIGQFSFARGAMFPNHWMAQGLQAAARGRFDDVVYHLALIWGNGLFLYLLTAWVARHYYRRGYNRLATGGLQRRVIRANLADRTLGVIVGFVQPQVRLLIIKDFRTFRRDPSQWAQVLIFTGLLTMYFVNVKGFYREDFGAPYQYSISLLNLTATALLLCAYTSRFIFPMLSLEGQKFWILGLLPLRRSRLLWGKFAFSATGGLIIAGFLVTLSDVMLGMPATILSLHLLIVVLVTAGLSGLSVGLGACMPNFRETDPSKIAVGTGGTLNLIVGLLFLVVLLGLMAVPCHLKVALTATPETSVLVTVQSWWIATGILAGIPVGLAAAVIPLWLGNESLSRMEF